MPTVYLCTTCSTVSDHVNPARDSFGEYDACPKCGSDAISEREQCTTPGCDFEIEVGQEYCLVCAKRMKGE